MKNSIPFTHCLDLTIRFSDLDAMQHVNNCAYLTYFEEARVHFFHDIMGLKRDSLAFNAVVARIEIDYIGMLMLGDTAKVYSRVLEVGTKSYKLENLIVKVENGVEKRIAKGITTMVSYDYQTNKSIPIPSEIRELYLNSNQ